MKFGLCIYPISQPGYPILIFSPRSDQGQCQLEIRYLCKLLLCLDSIKNDANYRKIRKHVFLLQQTADEVIDIFNQSEPSQLVSVCVSPAMVNISPARTLQILQHLEDTTGVSVTLTITMATMMLLLGDLPQYAQLIDRHAEVRMFVCTDDVRQGTVCLSKQHLELLI